MSRHLIIDRFRCGDYIALQTVAADNWS